MKKLAAEIINDLEHRIARLERQSFRFPRKPKPNSLTLVESEAGFHKFQVSGNATITLDDIVDFAEGAFCYFPSSQWHESELDREARRYSDGVYTDFGYYEDAFNKLFAKSIKKQVLISKNRSGDSIIVSFNAQGLYRSFRKIYSEGLHFLLNDKVEKGPKVVGQLMDNVIRNFDKSTSRIARLERQAQTKLETPTLKEVAKFLVTKVDTTFGRLKWDGREHYKTQPNTTKDYQFELMPTDYKEVRWYDSLEDFEDRYEEPLVDDIEYALEMKFPGLRENRRSWSLYCGSHGGVRFSFDLDFLPLG